MSGFEDIREHMEVIGADGVHIGTVDKVEGDRIKLTKADSGAGFEGGSHEGHHHFISQGLVAGIEGDQVRLSADPPVSLQQLAVTHLERLATEVKPVHDIAGTVTTATKPKRRPR